MGVLLLGAPRAMSQHPSAQDIGATEEDKRVLAWPGATTLLGAAGSDEIWIWHLLHLPNQRWPGQSWSFCPLLVPLHAKMDAHRPA